MENGGRDSDTTYEATDWDEGEVLVWWFVKLLKLIPMILKWNLKKLEIVLRI